MFNLGKVTLPLPNKLFLKWTVTLQANSLDNSNVGMLADLRGSAAIAAGGVRNRGVAKTKGAKQSTRKLTSECFFLDDKSRVVSYKLSTKFLRHGTLTSFFTACAAPEITYI